MNLDLRRIMSALAALALQACPTQARADAPRAPDAGPSSAIATSGCEVRTLETVSAKRDALLLVDAGPDPRNPRTIVQVRYQTATFKLPVGDTDGLAEVESLGWGTTVSSRVHAREVPLWIRATHTMVHGLLSPDEDMKFEVVRYGRDHVRVRLVNHPFIDFDTTPTEEDVPCEQLQATPSRGALEHHASKTRPVFLRVGRGLDVRTTPTDRGDKALRLVDPGAASHVMTIEAYVLERKGRFARVSIQSPHGSVTGWVPASALGRALKSGGVGMVGMLDGAGWPKPRGYQPRILPGGWTCSQPVRVAALPRWSPEPIWIGEVSSGTAIFPPWPEEVAPPGWTAMRVAGITKFLAVKQGDLNGCAPRR